MQPNSIDYISDLHLDKFENIKDALIASLPDENSKSNILIIAGNLAKDLNIILLGLMFYKKQYDYVLYTNGTLELQLTSREKEIFNNNSFDKINAIKYFIDTESFEDIYFLNGFDDQQVNLTKPLLSVAGLPMFWDYSNLPKNLSIKETMDLYKNLFSEDYENISFGNHKKIIAPKYFKNNLKRLNKISPCDIMVTNYCPLPSDKYFNSFDGKENIERIKPKIWFYGNSDNSDTKYQDTLLINTKSENKKIKTISIS